MAATNLRPLAGSGCKSWGCRHTAATRGMFGFSWQKPPPCSSRKAGNLHHMCLEETHSWVWWPLGWLVHNPFSHLLVRFTTSWQITHSKVFRCPNQKKKKNHGKVSQPANCFLNNCFSDYVTKCSQKSRDIQKIMNVKNKGHLIPLLRNNCLLTLGIYFPSFSFLKKKRFIHGWNSIVHAILLLLVSLSIL